MNKKIAKSQNEAKEQALLYLKAAQKHLHKLEQLMQRGDNCIEALTESQIARNYLKQSSKVILQDEFIKSFAVLKNDENNEESIKKIVKIFSLQRSL